MSAGLHQFTVFTNVSNLGDTGVLGDLKFHRVGGRLEGSGAISPRVNKGGVEARHSEQRALSLSPMSVF